MLTYPKSARWMTGAAALAALLLLGGCKGDGAPSGTASADATPPVADAAPPRPDTPPASACKAPPNLPADPLVVRGRASAAIPGKGPAHILDVDYDAAAGRVYVTGMPGFLVYDAPRTGAPRLLGSYPSGSGGKYEHLERLGKGVVALTARGNSSRTGGRFGGGAPEQEGLYLVDATAPASIRLLKHLKITSAAGSAAAGRYLYVLSHEGKLHTVDVATPASARIVHTLSGLGSPWELVVVGKRAYVADNRDGVVVVDLSTPSAPKLAARVAAAGGLQDIVHAGGKLYAAAGSAGVEVFDLADPAKPVSRGATPVGDAVISVSAAGGLLWVTDQARAGVLDISGARPRPLAFEATPSWAMHVHATGGTAYVADWNALAVLTFDPTKRAPQADLVPGEVYLDAATRTRTITLHNRGGATLDIATVAIDDPRLSVTVGRRALAPGEKATLTLTFKNDGKAVSARLCVATNDPDQPVQRIPVATTNTGSRLKVGDVAPNFQLPDLAGVRRELKAQLGSPVLLAYFATW